MSRKGRYVMQPLDGVVLAGGRSSRLGVDKALLRFGRQPLLAIVTHRLSQVCARVLVAVDREDRYRHLALAAGFIEDVSPGLGPLSGLQSGLRAAASEHALVVACDLPFLSVDLLRYMADKPRSYQALVPYADARWHPLHAIYSRSALQHVDALIASGGGSMHDLLARLDVQTVDEDAVRALDPDALSLLNLNREADVRRARALWRRRREVAPR